MPGPLPDPNARRRNAPTIPTTTLPAEGYDGPTPVVPASYDLGAAGQAWWSWAWRLPQAAGWSSGDLFALARRASIEDDLVALEAGDFDLAELLGMDDDGDRVRAVEVIIRKLKAMAGGKVSLMREARELDNRFGLTPKGLADLRWTIKATEAAPEPDVGQEDEVGKRRKERRERGVG